VSASCSSSRAATRPARAAIKRITEYLNPRIARVVALPAPTERERTQWYFQRYIEHLPAAGEIVLFDRSWYNRAGVERVHRVLHPRGAPALPAQCPIFERMLVEDGILLLKYWFSVSDAEQQRRFESRLTDPMRRWKLSTTDVESITRWEDYSRAKDEMIVHTDITAGAVVRGRRERGQASLAAQHDRPPALPGALRGGGGAGGRDAPAAAVARLRAGGPLAAGRRFRTTQRPCRTEPRPRAPQPDAVAPVALRRRTPERPTGRRRSAAGAPQR
jgi:hypothetical protein